MAAWMLVNFACGSLAFCETKIVPLGHPVNGELDTGFWIWHGTNVGESASTCCPWRHKSARMRLRCEPYGMVRSRKQFGYSLYSYVFANGQRDHGEPERGERPARPTGSSSSKSFSACSRMADMRATT